MTDKIDICYLCGQKLEKNVDFDHVPPKQIYAKSIRKIHSPNLLRLPTHKSCHTPYQKDEDYFVHSLGPLSMGIYSGNAIWSDISKQYKRPQGRIIGQMILNEFDKRPSGIVLPLRKVVKRFNGERIWRVVWKITRGLYLKEYGKFLPENIPNVFKIFLDEKPGIEFEFVRNTPSRGKYPEVFDYKYANFVQKDNFHLWAMLFWDMLIMEIGFHDSECPCDKCKANT